jgi:hypothetical protein
MSLTIDALRRGHLSLTDSRNAPIPGPLPTRGKGSAAHQTPLAGPQPTGCGGELSGGHRPRPRVGFLTAHGAALRPHGTLTLGARQTARGRGRRIRNGRRHAAHAARPANSPPRAEQPLGSPPTARSRLGLATRKPTHLPPSGGAHAFTKHLTAPRTSQPVKLTLNTR